MTLTNSVLTDRLDPYRLPRHTLPSRYDVELEPDLAAATFRGRATIEMATSEATDVLVLNASYEPLQRVSVRHAIGMLYRQVAVVEEEVDGSRFGPYPMPRVLRLVRYVVMKWVHRGTPPCTKAGIHARDRVCAYCGGKATTVDHVVPRSRGGGSTWTNLVSDDRLAETCDVTFDLTVHNLFLAAEAGASLHILSALEMMAPGRFVRARDITVWMSL